MGRVIARRLGGWAALLSVALLVAAACGGGAEKAPRQPPAPASGTPGLSPAPAPGTPSPPAASVLQVAMATTDFSVGPNRVAFGLIGGPSGPVRDADVQVSTFYLAGERVTGPVETAKAVFRRWPGGPGGVYTALLTFDKAGPWGLGVTVTLADGSKKNLSAAFQAKERSQTPSIGAIAPRSANKTANNVKRLEELTTDPSPDPEMYAMSIAEAMDSGMPLVVVFATPAYSQSATSGPQVDVVKGLKSRYKGRANFIHVEIYDNLSEMQGNLSNARLSPTVSEWNLPSEPWTFVLGKGGLVHAKFEGFATAEELEEALAAALQ